MSYYRRRYKRPYYYHNNRSYYNRNNSSPEGSIAAIIVILLSIGLISFMGKNPIGFILGVFEFIIFIGVIVLVIFGIRRLIKRGNKISEPGVISVNREDAAQINSEKHGCKCYMEGLTYGEQEVADTLARELSYKDYFIFNNLIIPSENNGSTQIDHIVISKFGIFVIESKDYKGWIFGDKDQPFWTQSLPDGKNKFQFQNPIHQNFAHIMALKTLMPFATDCFYSIVVFSSNSEIKTIPIENVVHVNQLIGCIKKYTQEKLTENDVQLAIGKLSYACQTVDITASEHIANLNANHQD